MEQLPFDLLSIILKLLFFSDLRAVGALQVCSKCLNTAVDKWTMFEEKQASSWTAKLRLQQFLAFFSLKVGVNLNTHCLIYPGYTKTAAGGRWIEYKPLINCRITSKIRNPGDWPQLIIATPGNIYVVKFSVGEGRLRIIAILWFDGAGVIKQTLPRFVEGKLYPPENVLDVFLNSKRQMRNTYPHTFVSPRYQVDDRAPYVPWLDEINVFIQLTNYIHTVYRMRPPADTKSNKDIFYDLLSGS
jgi:hypothetical protein